MTAFIVQEADPFEAIAEQQRARSASRRTTFNVRRPTRGLQAGKDTYAHLRVVDADGQDLEFLDSGASEVTDGIGHSTAYSNFLLQRVAIQRSELRQFVKTFGLTYLFLFGENPIMVQVTGALIHSVDFPWDEEWWANYESMLRATKLAELGARAYLCYEGTLIEGYVLEAGTNREATTPNMAPLNFNMVATAIKFLNPVGVAEMPFDRYTVDLMHESSTQGSRALGNLLPVGRAMVFDAASASAQAAAMASLSASDPQSLVQFGTFQDLFRFFAATPGLLAGISTQGVGAALLAAESRPAKVPPVVRGNRWLNEDEYVQRTPPQLARTGNPFDRVDRYQQQVEVDEERPVAGDAARSVIDTDDPDSINMANTEGLEGSHGTGMVEDGTLAPLPPGDPLALGSWGGRTTRPRIQPRPGQPLPPGDPLAPGSWGGP